MDTQPSPRTFQAPEPAVLSDLLPGYSVQSLIAVGGMGAVYHAVQNSLHRVVAIKILPEELGADEAYRARFETEAKAMALLNHPNLAGVYDFGHVGDLLYIVMEFVEGESLYHHAYGHCLEEEAAIRFTRGICLGLHHAHQNGVLHRDIKPSNVLLDLQGQPKIVDFGLAQGIRQAPGKDEDVYGTPHYTAPEVLTLSRAVDARADIFSVGVILHELLTGHVPASDPRPPSTIVSCDPRLDGVVRKATHPNPDLRYTSAAEMAADLDIIDQTPAPRALRTVKASPPAWAPAGQRGRLSHMAGRRLPPGAPAVSAMRPLPGSLSPRRPRVPLKPQSSSGGMVILIILLVLAIIGLLIYQALRG